MKINGLLGLLISIASFGSVSEGQIVYQSTSNQPIYQNTSVVPATYVAPSATIPSPTITSAPYSVSSVRQSTSRATTSSFTGNTGSGLAQSKASTAARMGIRGHLGGGLGNAKDEGVGWSNQSSQSAIQSCCYWGKRPVAEIGVARGRDGFWYACVLYR